MRRARSSSSSRPIVCFTLRRTGDTTWTSSEEKLPWVTDTIVVSGRIEDNLYQALDDSAASVLPKGARAELAWTLADIFEYRVDMSRELQPGDAFRVLFERQPAPGDHPHWAHSRRAHGVCRAPTTEAVRFDEGNGAPRTSMPAGRSMQAAFLRAPLAFRRISSVFGLRKHPILGIVRRHEGTDYAADAGTPVRTIGDGVVTFAGRRGGYGNIIEIRHRIGLVSRYGHLRGFAAGIHAGRTVTIGQTIGYVGMTGLATGPHLHFELLVDGTQRDPAVALRRNGGTPLASSEKAAFDEQKTVLLASSEQGRGVATRARAFRSALAASRFSNARLALFAASRGGTGVVVLPGAGSGQSFGRGGSLRCARCPGSRCSRSHSTRPRRHAAPCRPWPRSTSRRAGCAEATARGGIAR